MDIYWIHMHTYTNTTVLMYMFYAYLCPYIFLLMMCILKDAYEHAH